MSVTPDFIGQIYKDTNTGNLWRANSLTPGDWTLELQNFNMKWTPTMEKMSELGGITYQLQSSASVTDMTFLQTTTLEGIIVYFDSLIGLHFPNLATVDPDYFWGSNLDIQCKNLTTLDLPVLQKMGSGKLSLVGCAKLASLSLPSLQEINGDLDANHCTLLQTVSLPNFLPTNGKRINFIACALSQSSVDHILARCVASASYASGTVDLYDGTNSAPSSTGVGSDYAILTARGVVVNVNP